MPAQKQEQAEVAVSEFMTRMGVIPSHPRTLAPQLDKVLANMATVNWPAEELKLTQGRLFINTLGGADTLPPAATFAESPVGRMLLEASRRARTGCQHAITDLALDESSVHVSVRSLAHLEMLLLQLPQWSIEAGKEHSPDSDKLIGLL